MPDPVRAPTHGRGFLGTVRLRTVVAATAIVGVALLLGAAALVSVMARTLTGEVRSAARLRAFSIAEGLEKNDANPLPEFTDEDELIEIISPTGALVATSPALVGQARLPALQPGETGQTTVAFDDDEFVVVAVSATTPAGRFQVAVALSLSEVDDATTVVRRLLVIGLPVLLLLVASTLWNVVGRALAPVEAIRAEVDLITSTELGRRVPQPAGGDEISRLARTMNQMLGRLDNAQATQRRFVSDASHELRSPVASIRTHAEVALAHPELTTTTKLAEVVMFENLRVQSLVEDLLFLARADENTLAPARVAIDLDDLVLAQAGRLRGTATIRIDTTGVGAGRVLGDVRQLRRLLANLADNAANHARSQVSFTVTEQSTNVVLYVDDDGPGIPAAERTRVLERFVRLDADRGRDAGGSGLGLAIVAEITATHGGTIVVADSPAGGARLALTLPRLAD